MEYPIYCCFPHTRGKFTFQQHTGGRVGAFPPYAGEVYSCLICLVKTSPVSPIRGGSLLAFVMIVSSSSRFPHTRGKFTKGLSVVPSPERFPPYAGEVYQWITSEHIMIWVSPIRGGSLPESNIQPEIQHRFPHTRGKFTNKE